MTATSLLPKIAAGRGIDFPRSASASSSAPRSRPEGPDGRPLSTGCGRKLARGSDRPEHAAGSRCHGSPRLQEPRRRGRRRSYPCLAVAGRSCAASCSWQRSPRADLAIGLLRDGWACAAPRTSRSRNLKVRGFAARPAELLRLAGLAPGQNLWSLDRGRDGAGHGAAPLGPQRRGHPAACPTPLRCSVEEHVPVALASLGDLYVLDAEGAPFKRVSPAETLDLPLRHRARPRAGT